jgi:hypothetical protein
MAAGSSEPEEKREVIRCMGDHKKPDAEWCCFELVVDHDGLMIAPLLVRLLLPETGSSGSEASRFLLWEELLLERGQSSKGLRFLTLAALRATGEAGASSSSATESSPAALNAMSAVRFMRLVEGGVARCECFGAGDFIDTCDFLGVAATF